MMEHQTLTPRMLDQLDAYFRAANALSIGQIEHEQHVVRHGEDMPENRSWKWRGLAGAS